MTYEKLYELKHVRGLSTCELLRRYPNKAEKVSTVALLDLPDATLKEVIADESHLNQILSLKKKLSKK